MFESVDRQRLAAFSGRRTPSIADLFVAVMSGAAQGGVMNSQYVARRELGEPLHLPGAACGRAPCSPASPLDFHVVGKRFRGVHPADLHRSSSSVRDGAIIRWHQLVVAIFYCLDALYGERRDRSILFWKSMPISDLTAVVSKASIPILVIPLMAFVATVVTQVVMLVLSGMVLSANGISSSMVWDQMSLADIVRSTSISRRVPPNPIRRCMRGCCCAGRLGPRAFHFSGPSCRRAHKSSVVAFIARSPVLQVLFFGFPTDAPSASVMHGMTMEMMALPFTKRFRAGCGPVSAPFCSTAETAQLPASGPRSEMPRQMDGELMNPTLSVALSPCEW